MKQSVAGTMVIVVLLLATACARKTELKLDDKSYIAYGDTWVYSKTEIEISYVGLNSSHGVFGRRNGYKETHLLRNSAGKTISIPENLFALQRNGTLKKIECCQYFRERGDLYNIDDKLVFIFDNARRYITDCFVYPSGHPDNESRPPGDRIYGVTVFAEFDPEANVFKAATFDAGDNYLPFEYLAAELRTGRRDLTLSEHYAFLHGKRKPFICENRGLPPTSNGSTFAIEGYRRGTTRTIRISVAPATRGSFVSELQGFASRNAFKWWQAASAAGRDVSLALQRNDILVIAAAVDDEVWRVGFYDAKAEPPSEQDVVALVSKMRGELERLPGVTFLADAG